MAKTKERRLKELKLEKLRRGSTDIDPSFIGGVAREAATGATFGAAPFIEAGARTLVGDETFGEELEDIREQREAFQKENPKTAMGADIAGSIASGLLIPGSAVAKLGTRVGLGVTEGGLREAAEGGDAEDIALSSALGGGLAAIPGPKTGKQAIATGLGGAVGFGTAEKGEELGGTLKGAATGLIGSKALGAIKRKVFTIDAIQKVAKRAAIKATGATETQINKILKSGAESSEVAEALLKPVKGQAPVLSAGTTKSGMLKKLTGRSEPIIDEDLLNFIDPTDYSKGGIISQLGKQVDDVIRISENAFEQKTGQKFRIAREELVEDVEARLQAELIDLDRPADFGKTDIDNMLGIINGFLEGKGPFTLTQINKLKRRIGGIVTDGSFLKDTQNLPNRKKAFRVLYDRIKEEVEDKTSQLAPQFADKVRDLNRENSSFIKASQLLEKGVSREAQGGGLQAIAAKTGIPLISGVAGVATSGSAGGVAAAITSLGALEASRKFGLQAVADALSSYKIPRSAKGILREKDFVVGKILASGAPKAAELAQELIGSDDIGKVSRLVPLVAGQFPNLFVESSFASEFDGKLHDPMDKAAYKGEVSKREDISTIEKAKRIHKMNKHSELEVEAQQDDSLDSIINGLIGG